MVKFCLILILISSFIICGLSISSTSNCKSIGTECVTKHDCKVNKEINSRDCLCVFRNETIFGEDVGVCMPKTKYLKNCKHQLVCDDDVCFCSQGDCDFCFNDLDCTGGRVCENQIISINGKQECTPSGVICPVDVGNLTCAKVCVLQVIVPPVCDICMRNLTTGASICENTNFTCSIGGRCYYSNVTDCFDTNDRCNPLNLGAECPALSEYTASCAIACNTLSSCYSDCTIVQQNCFATCGSTLQCFSVCTAIKAACDGICNL